MLTAQAVDDFLWLMAITNSMIIMDSTLGMIELLQFNKVSRLWNGDRPKLLKFQDFITTQPRSNPQYGNFSQKWATVSKEEKKKYQDWPWITKMNYHTDWGKILKKY